MLPFKRLIPGVEKINNFVLSILRIILRLLKVRETRLEKTF